MIVVADTGPLNYLVPIGAIDVLQPLYARVIKPEAVVEELKQAGAPSAVLAWIAKPPVWLEVRPEPPADPSLDFLDPGERSALTLAESLDADELLIDELAGRMETARRRLHVTGTLGVLAEAHLAGLLDFDRAIERLRTTSFRLSPEVERLVGVRPLGCVPGNCNLIRALRKQRQPTTALQPTPHRYLVPNHRRRSQRKVECEDH